MQSLRPSQRRYFESILNMTATKDELMRSLYKLTLFLADKFRRNVIVLIDEYEAPNNRAYEHGYFNDVRSPHPSITVGVEDKYSRPMIFSGVVYFLFS